MEEGDGTGTFTDETWAIWEPLIEAVRPKGKTPPHDLRRTLAAIFWRHENDAKWRSIPAELGPWWRAAQLFIRWAKLGVWERLLALVQEQQGLALGMIFLDSTNIRARRKEWRAVATRYEKTATSFLAVIHIAAAADRIKP
ncbi:transposase [Komagataeibacter diospyri]|nr:transposase [Komagataeibacter diospyri]